MEQLFAFPRKLRKSVSDRVTPQSSSWSSQELEHYMLGLAKGREESLAFSKQFPPEIPLKSALHNALNYLREKAHQERIEKLGVIGRYANAIKVYIPAAETNGSLGIVTRATRLAIMGESLRQGIQAPICNIHSHARTVKEETEEALSAHDLYLVVIPKNELLAVVAEWNTNIFAFKTRESLSVPLGVSGAHLQEEFAKHWYARCGYKYLGFNQNGVQVISEKESATTWGVCEAIAQHHKLVLYKGRPNKNIIRVFP